MLTIGDVASRTGLRRSAIRYYEAQGLMPVAHRKGSKRIYDASILDRLALIEVAKAAGLSLQEIRDVLAGGGQRSPASIWRKLADAKRAELDEQISRLADVKDVLSMLTRCRCATLDDCGRAARTAVLLTLAGSSLGQAPVIRTHRLEATPATVAYGYYWADAKPVLRIASGDVIDVDTLLTNTPTGLQRAGVPPEKIQESLKAIVAEVTGDRRGPGGHILTGPVYVDGAAPGDVLEVKILSIDFAIDYGYNGCSGFIPRNCDPSVPQKILRLDTRTMTSEFKPGIVLRLRPFFGSMGVAPAAELGRVSSNPPGKHAGNLDNRELVAGSTLYIPVFVAGALFQIGDGHAAQGDGEVDQTAIETSLRGRVQLTVRKDMKLVWPRAETSTDYISMAADEDLKMATTIAVQEMVDFLGATKKLTGHEAYQLVSLAGNVAITQLVDRPVYGVHVKMPKDIFK